MSAQFIGSKISLISKSEIRYEGILYTIDPKESTIALAKVRSFGTEDRVTDKPVAPRNEVYEYIIFRASDIKDLLVDDPPAATSPALADPAIIQAQSVAGSSANSFPSTTFPSGASGHAGSASAGQPAKQSTLSSVLGRSTPTGEKSTSRRSSPGLRAKSPSESQSGDHRSGQRNDPSRSGGAYTGRPGASHVNNFRRDNRQGPPRNPPNNANPNRQNQRSDWPARQVPGTQRNRPRPAGMLDVRKLEEFDFEKANAEFEELTKDVEELKISEGKEDEVQTDEQKKENLETYNKAKSFFDTISCESTERKKGNMARVDRRQERKLNQETFGVSGVYNRNWNRNGPRLPPRNRNYNQGGRGGPPRNNGPPGQGGRRYGPRNTYNNNNRSFGGDRRPQGEKAPQETNSNSTGTGGAPVWGPAQ